MDMHKIRKLIAMGKHTDIAEIVVGNKKESVRIVYKQTSIAVGLQTSLSQTMTQAGQQRDTEQRLPATQKANEKYILKSSLVGRVYLSSFQDEKPFVEIGHKIKAGEVLCIIKSMGMLHQIESDRNGIISDIFIETGSGVEFDQPLFEIDLSKSI